MQSIDIVVGRGMKLWVDGLPVRDFNYDSGDDDSTAYTITVKGGAKLSLDMGVKISEFLEGKNPEAIAVSDEEDGVQILKVRNIITVSEGGVVTSFTGPNKLEVETQEETKLTMNGEELGLDETQILVSASK